MVIVQDELDFREASMKFRAQEEKLQRMIFGNFFRQIYKSRRKVIKKNGEKLSVIGVEFPGA